MSLDKPSESMATEAAQEQLKKDWETINDFIAKLLKFPASQHKQYTFINLGEELYEPDPHRPSIIIVFDSKAFQSRSADGVFPNGSEPLLISILWNYPNKIVQKIFEIRSDSQLHCFKGEGPQNRAYLQSKSITQDPEQKKRVEAILEEARKRMTIDDFKKGLEALTAPILAGSNNKNAQEEMGVSLANSADVSELADALRLPFIQSQLNNKLKQI